MNHEVFELAWIIWSEMLAVLGTLSGHMQLFVRTQAQAWHRDAYTEAHKWCSRSTWHEIRSNLHGVLAVVLACVMLAGCYQRPMGEAGSSFSAPVAVAAPLAEPAEPRAAPCLAQCSRDALLERLEAAVERAHGAVQQAQGTLDTAHDALDAARNLMAIDCHEDHRLC